MSTKNVCIIWSCRLNVLAEVQSTVKIPWAFGGWKDEREEERGREGVRKGEKGREGWESANSPCK